MLLWLVCWTSFETIQRLTVRAYAYDARRMDAVTLPLIWI